MALKAVLSKAEFDALPEATRGFYGEKNGSYTLAVEGMVPQAEAEGFKSQLKEFRDNNITILQERDRLKSEVEKFTGIDVSEYTTLKAEKAKLTAKGVKNTDDLESIITTQIAAATKPLLDQMSALKVKEESAQRELQSKSVDDVIRSAALKAGVQESALDFVLHRGRQVFKYNDGKVVAMEGDRPKFSDTQPSQPLAAEEWVAGLAKEASYAFKPSTGGGAGGGSGSGGPGPTKTLSNPSPVEFGKNLAEIAAGKTEVRTA